MTPAIRIGISGIAGWRVLQRVETRQLDATAKDPVIQRTIAHYRENISGDTTAEDLIGDYKMLQVVLGAFGLEKDVGNKALIRKVLESDIGDSASLVNRLSDKRYLELAREFQSHPDRSARADTVTHAYVQHQFQMRVREGDESYGLALNARNALRGFAERSSNDRTMWYEVLGNSGLRKVFEGAFGFGSAIANLPVDRQVDRFMTASNRIMGSSSFAKLGSEEAIERLITRYLALSQIQGAASTSRYTPALALLSG